MTLNLGLLANNCTALCTHSGHLVEQSLRVKEKFLCADFDPPPTLTMGTPRAGGGYVAIWPRCGPFLIFSLC